MRGLHKAVGSIPGAMWVLPLAILGCGLACKAHEWRTEQVVRIGWGYDEGDIGRLGFVGPDGPRFEVGF